jgi:His/Glu/Gln/Arg/opine family amino acid ABC transporter permease subunit
MHWGDYVSLLRGVGVTLGVSLAAIAIGVPIGLGLALIRWSGQPILAPLAAVFVSVMRATPAVTLGLLLFFALPVVGISLDAVPAGIIALALITAAFNSEIWRAGLVNFPRDQIEAALSIGMRRGQRFRRIIFPQVVRASLPALVNEMTLLVKVTPAIAVLGVVDVTRAAVRIGAATYRPLPPFIAALVLYSLIVLVFVQLHRVVERRIGQAVERRMGPAVERRIGPAVERRMRPS